MAADPEPEVPAARRMVIEGYELGRRLGEGAMGMVYEAVRDDGRRAAIKLLHPEMVEHCEARLRFLNEARALGLLQHPGLVAILGAGELPDRTPYIVMELLEGESLRGRLGRLGGRLPLPEIAELGRQAAEALGTAHERRIIHRDLKPDNLMLQDLPEGGLRVKVFDFSIARLPQEHMPMGEKLLNTRRGQTLGTPLYMAPEQCQPGDLTVQVDVYALGIVLYRCLTGRPPFIPSKHGEAGEAEVMARHIGEPPPPLGQLAPGVPEELAALVHAMLAKAPAERPTMREVADALAGMQRRGLVARELPAPLRSSASTAAAPVRRLGWRRLIGVGAVLAWFALWAAWAIGLF